MKWVKQRAFNKKLPKTYVPFGQLLPEHTVQYAQVVKLYVYYRLFREAERFK